MYLTGSQAGSSTLSRTAVRVLAPFTNLVVIQSRKLSFSGNLSPWQVHWSLQYHKYTQHALVWVHTHTHTHTHTLLGLCIELWKVTKVVQINVDSENLIAGIIPRISFVDRPSYESSTKEYDMVRETTAAKSVCICMCS